MVVYGLKWSARSSMASGNVLQFLPRGIKNVFNGFSLGFCVGNRLKGHCRKRYHRPVRQLYLGH